MNQASQEIKQEWESKKNPEENSKESTVIAFQVPQRWSEQTSV